MELNYIILAHTQPKSLKRLISRLQFKGTSFYIHVDKKSELTQFENELVMYDNVYLIKERIDVIWGDFSQVQATLKVLQRIIQDKKDGYCILMSGLDYPIKSNEYINSFFYQNKGKNFINLATSKEAWKAYINRIYRYNFHPIPTQRINIQLNTIYSRDFFSRKNFYNIFKLIGIKKDVFILKYLFIKRENPQNLEPFGGSQWWALPVETIKRILDFVYENPSYVKFHKFTHVPDEVFFHTIIANIERKENIEKSVTYVNWSRKNCPLPVSFNDLVDFQELKSADKLFARKFESNTKLLDKIDSELLGINFNIN